MVGFARASCLALACVTWLAGAVRGQTRADLEIQQLRFEGNEAFGSDVLSGLIQTRETGCSNLIFTPVCALTNWGFAHTRGFLDESDIEQDRLRLELFHRFSGYLEATVDTALTRDQQAGEATVTFLIEQGPLTRVDSLMIVGLDEAVPYQQAAEVIGVGSGDPFDQWRLELGMDSLKAVLRDRGYVETAVLKDAFVPTGEGAEVVIEVFPGTRYRFGDIRIEGAGAIGEDVVSRLLLIRPGQYYSDSRIDESQRTLFGLDAVRFASIETEVAGDSVVDVAVRITPANPRTARGGFGWSTDECFQVETRLTHRNILGGAKRLEITARLENIFAEQFSGSFPCSAVGQDPAFRGLNFFTQAQFSVPVFLSSRNNFSAALFAERESVPDVFIREGVGGSVSISRQLGRRMTATLSYQPAFTGFGEESADIFFCVNFGFCTPEDVDVVTQARWLAPLNLSWVSNRTNDPLQPTNGHYLRAEVERAERFTASDYRYVRFVLAAADFETVATNLVVGARARAGVIEPTRGPFFVQSMEADQDIVIHPSKRFFAGGSQSVRGVGQNLLGPRVLVVDAIDDCDENEELLSCVQRLAADDPNAFNQRPVGGNASFEFSFEVRRTLSPRWGVVGFLDVGQVWRDLSELEAPLWTPGIGIRFRSPVGPLRLDVGYDPRGVTTLPVVVSFADGALLELDNPVRFDPFSFDDASGFKQLLRRLQIHFAIGEAF